MDKIIVVGHPSSGLGEVEGLLHKNGMKPARLSRREGLSAPQVAEILCKEHNAPPLETATSKVNFQQLEVGSVWQTLTLDLLLGNAEQSFWGWADPHSIFLLDHWLTQAPRATFILVYDEPGSAVRNAMFNPTDQSDKHNIRQYLENWSAYNGAILRFFLRNPDRCLLVQSQQVRENEVSFLAKLRDRTFKPTHGDSSITAPERGVPNIRSAYSPLPGVIDSIFDIVGRESPDASQVFDAAHTDRFLAECHLAEHPAITCLYEELQAAADLPFDDSKTPTGKSRNAWKSFLRQRRFTEDILEKMLSQYESLRDIHTGTSCENKLLLAQLHQVQDELEATFNQNRKLTADNTWYKNEIENLRSKVARPETEIAANRHYGAAERVKQQLSYRLGSTIVTCSKTFGGCLRMPFALISETNDFNRGKSVRPKYDLPPLSTYSDYQDAERVMNQLSYRVGKVFVKNMRSPLGWLRLPFALRHQVLVFNEIRREQSESIHSAHPNSIFSGPNTP